MEWYCRACAGQNLLERILDINRTDWRATLPYYQQLGSWLAMIHTYRCEPKYTIRSSELGRVKDELWSIPFVPRTVVQQSYEALCRIED